MNEDHMEPSTSTSTLTPAIAADPPPPTSPTSSSSTPPLLLHPRRELFEHGLLPIPKLIFADGTLTLDSLKQKLLSHASRVNAPDLADALQIPIEQAALVIDTLASIMGEDGGRVEGTADVYDLVLFLYIQTYKKLLPRTHKDSVAVTDVWPSTSAFDGYLSALSPLQLVRSNSRRSMPSQADEEVHQLSYLQKHMPNMLSLLAESVEGEGDDLLVLSLEQFEHLGLLIQFGEKGFEGIQLSQAAPFFANSDPDMPASPVSASQVHEWILQKISISLEHRTEKVSAKENDLHAAFDVDAAMTDASTNHTRSQSGSSPLESNAAYSRDLSFVEGVSKASVVKQDCDIKGGSIKVLNCHDSVIYILAPLRYATIYGCSDATIVLGAVGKATRVEHCERVHVIVAAKRICIANCRECIFYLGVNERPLVVGDNHKLQVAPYNTFYARLIEHMNQVRLDPTTNRWNEPLVLGVVDPHDSLSHPAGVSDVQAESATCLDPDVFTNFIIPNWFGDEPSQPTKDNPFPLPENYMASLRKHHLVVNEIQQSIRGAELQHNKNRELANAIHIHFKEWLYASGNIRQLYCIQEN